MVIMSKESPPVHYYTVRQVAKHLGVSETTVRRAIERQELDAYRVGWQYRITPKQVTDWLDPKSVTPIVELS